MRAEHRRATTQRAGALAGTLRCGKRDRLERGDQLGRWRGDGRGEQRGRPVGCVEAGHGRHLVKLSSVALRAAAAVHVEVDVARDHPAPAHVDDLTPAGATQGTAPARPPVLTRSARR